MQDIEAEDHILGPLSLRQFIFALVMALFAYLSVLSVMKQVYFLLAVFVPPALLAGFFAFPFGRDQPTEIWALAKLRFWFKPRKRIWNQSGVKELVTITVPKKIEHVYTNGLSQTEVQSRLKALAQTIDSRGWAVKNVAVNSYVENPLAPSDSDRLVSINNVPQNVQETGILASDDMLDTNNNPIAQQFDVMMDQSSQAHHQQLLQQLNSPTPTPQAQAAVSTDPWFMGGAPIVQADSGTPEEAAVLARSRAQNTARHAGNDHLRTLQPLGSQAAQPASTQTRAGLPAATPVTAMPDPAILALANNDDLNVATLAREAQKAHDSAEHASQRKGDGEVVISLR